MSKQQRSQAGFTLPEVAIGTAILGAVLIAVLAALAGGTVTSARVRENTTLLNLARSQLEFVQSQAYSEKISPYSTVANIPEGFTIETQVETLVPGFLQIVTVKANGDNTHSQVSTYKTNRLNEAGRFPVSSGLEAIRSIPIPTPLEAQRGFFFVIEVPESAIPGAMAASWQVSNKSQPDLQITIYAGRPFGLATSGVSSLVPEDLASFILASANKEPRGITTDGTHFWVVDHEPGPGRVFQYTMTGSLVGSFVLDSANKKPDGIARDGTHLWVVDDGPKPGRVFKYTVSGSLVSSFTLANTNTDPEGITARDGFLWVVNDSGDHDDDDDDDDDDDNDATPPVPGRVFQYTTSGVLVRSFLLDAANARPQGIATDGSHFWVVDEKPKPGRVFKYTFTGSLVGSFALDVANKKPRGITTDGVSLWVVSEKGSTGRVFQYTTGGTLAPIIGTLIRAPVVATGRERGPFLRVSSSIPADTYTLYYFNWGSSDVFTAVEPVDSFFLANSTHDPTGLATDGTHIWAVDEGDDFARVFQYTRDGVLVRTFLLAGTDQEPTGIATDGTRLWVVDEESDRVFQYTTTGSLVGSFALHKDNSNPTGISAHGGHLWVVNRDGDAKKRRVFQYTVIGGLVSSFLLHANNREPEGIAHDGSNLWVVDEGSDLPLVYKYTLDGVLLGIFGVDGAHDEPTGITSDGRYLWIIDEEIEPEPGRIIQYRLTPAALVSCICP